jgi:hypothetical protein
LNNKQGEKMKKSNMIILGVFLILSVSTTWADSDSSIQPRSNCTNFTEMKQEALAAANKKFPDQKTTAKNPDGISVGEPTFVRSTNTGKDMWDIQVLDLNSCEAGVTVYTDADTCHIDSLYVYGGTDQYCG